MVQKKNITMLERKNNVKEFSKLIKQTRVEKGLSLRDVEKATGISYSYLSQLESANRNIPKLDTIGALFNFYDLPLEKMQEFKHADFLIPLKDKLFVGQIKTNVQETVQKKRVEHLVRCFMDLPEERQQELLNFLDYLLKKEKLMFRRKGACHVTEMTLPAVGISEKTTKMKKGA